MPPKKQAKHLKKLHELVRARAAEKKATDQQQEGSAAGEYGTEMRDEAGPSKRAGDAEDFVQDPMELTENDYPIQATIKRKKMASLSPPPIKKAKGNRVIFVKEFQALHLRDGPSRTVDSAPEGDGGERLAFRINMTN
jgi:hypothetical protein